jgi:hypothetical protein
MPQSKKKPETLEHHIGHTADEIAEISRRLDAIEAHLSQEPTPTSDGSLDARVKALEEWRHALRKHTHQWLHDTGWKEPQ